MRRLIPSTHALAAFEASAHYLNFTRAGEALGLTQSGVSRQISTLEQQLGTPLFERVGPKLKLTDAGRSYADEVTRILGDLETASIDVVRGSNEKQLLRIAVQYSLVSTWLAPRLPEYLRQHPEDTLFQIDPVQETQDDVQEPSDISILRGRGTWSEAYSHPLIEELVGVVAAPSVTREAEIPPDRFTQYPMLQAAHRHDFWLRWFDAKGVPHSGQLQGPRFTKTTALIEAAVAGLGLAVLPIVMIEKHLAGGSLRLVAGDPVQSGFGYYVVLPQVNAHRPEVMRFRDWIIRETRSYRMKPNVRRAAPAE